MSMLFDDDARNLAMRSLLMNAARQPMDPMAEQAQELWPEDNPHADHNRREWIRAVRLVRNTKRGWLADPMEKQ